MTTQLAAQYERYHAEILRYVRRMMSGHPDAEDVAMQVWLEATKCADRELQKAWFYRVARCRVIDWVRAKRRQATTSIEDVMPLTEPFEEQVHDRLLLCAIWRTPMAERQRRAAWLHFVEDRTLAEVADQLGVRWGGAKALVWRARMQLGAGARWR